MTSSASTLLLVTHVALKTGPQGLLIDDQTASGLAQWSRHFDKVTYYGIDAGARNSSSATWVDLRDHSQTKACELVALPRAYEPLSMLKHYGSVRRDLKAAISNHRHLSFTFGGLFGDWPAVAAREAIRQNRRYGAWIDRVEPLVVRNKIEGASFGRKLMWRCLLPAITHNVNHLVRNSGVALLQGMDTFEHYAKLSADPHCTYDTHTLVSDEITLQELAVKTAGISAGAPIKILYVGRAAAMKGPGDWLSTLEILRDRNVPFQATWIGDGSQLPAMKMRIAEKELSAHVDLPGFEGDREVLLRRMKESDIFLFCHKTPESPRCLIEALVSGCPLVGYDTAYSRGLVAAQGGASLVPQDDVMALADRITTLNQDRASLCALITAAAATGKLYNEDIVYERRAELMMRA